MACIASLFAVQCGGSQPATNVPEKSATRSQPSERPETAPSETESAPPASARRCADGTCFACGTGICPSGFFCDEGAAGGAACSWLPACASKSGCGCYARVLAGCTCDDAEGGAHVHCK